MAEDEMVAAWVARLRVAAETGESFDLAAGLAPESTARNPAHAKSWGTERQLPAAALRTVLIDRDLIVDPHGLRINGARITGPVDLAHVQFKHPLHLTACRVEHDIDLTGSTWKELNLAGSHVTSLRLDQATITGNLLAHGGFTANGKVRAPGARIGGQLNLSGATLTNPGGIALALDGATVTGGLFARDGFTANGEVRAPGASIGGHLDLTGATLTNPDGIALTLDQVTIDGALLASNGFTAKGEVRAIDATIGTLQLDGATLTNPDGIALVLDRATITGGLFASNGFTTKGEVRAIDATIGTLQLDGATLTNPGKTALTLDQATVTGFLLARGGFTTQGEVRAIDTSIGGQLDLSAAILTNPDGTALRLDGATVTGDLFARNGFTAQGTIRAVGASIGGTLELNGATLTTPNRIALDLDRATITGALLALNRFTTKGEVRATDATIGGTLDLSGATLTNPDGIALTLDRATITGGLLARKGFTATGQVRAIDATIDGTLYLDGATLTNPGGSALTVQSSTITTLRLTPTRVAGTIDLTRATITDLWTPEGAVPDGPLIATGWQITDMHGLIRTNRRAATCWLNTTPSGHGFTAQPWHGLAAVYDRNGQPADARRLRYKAANKVTKHAPWYSKPLRWTYRAVAGHGYYPLLAAVWLVIALILGTVLVAYNRADFVPTDPVAARTAAETHAQNNPGTPPPSPIAADVDCTLYPDYPCFSRMTYTLTNVIPAAIGNPKPDWTTKSGASLLVTWGLPILRILSWVFTAILLAGVTGLLRKT